MNNRNRQLALAVRGLVLVIVLSASAIPAKGNDSSRAAVWALIRPDGTVAANSAYSSQGGGAVTSARTSKGQYAIDVPPIDTTAGGVAHAVAVGRSPHVCNIASWGSAQRPNRVEATCRDSRGSLEDMAFFVFFYRESRFVSVDSHAAYVFANQPSNGSGYEPPSPFSWNSRGGVNRVSRTATGRYQVNLASLGAAPRADSVLVTAVNSAARCVAAGWPTVGADRTVSISCDSAAGTPTDSAFALSYFSDFTFGLSSGETQFQGAYALAGEPLLRDYAPASAYKTLGGGAVRIRRLATGRYRVTNANAPGGRSIAMVTRYGGAGYCSVRTQFADGVVDVQCARPGGEAEDARFALTSLSPSTVAFLPLPSSTSPPVSTVDARAWLQSSGAASNPGIAAGQQSSSSGQAAALSRTGIGVYRVQLPGLAAAAASGIVHVSAKGMAATCRAVSWGAVNSNLEIQVTCTGLTTGSAVDSLFSLLFYSESRTSANAGFAGSFSTAASSTLAPSVAWNGRGGAVSIARPSTGRYTVRLEGVSASPNGGGVLVTAYGPGTSRCAAVEWNAPVLEVACVTPAGAPVDSGFGASLFTDVGFGGPSPATGMFLAADAPTASAYTPSALTSYHTEGGAMLVRRFGTGNYEVQANGLKADAAGLALVSAYGAAGAASSCQAAGWNALTGTPGTAISVVCAGPSGAPADSPFTLLYTTTPASPGTVEVVSGSGQSSPSGAAFAAPLRVRVLDSNLPLPGIPVQFQAQPGVGGASAALNPATATTNSLGIAETYATANSQAGSYSVRAASGGGSAVFSLTNSSVSTLPPPVLATVAPTVLTAGVQANLTVAGANFDPSTARIEFGTSAMVANAGLSSRSAVQLTAPVNLPAGTYAVRVVNGSSGLASSSVTLTVNAPPGQPAGGSGSHFVPIAPCRAADTRNGNAPVAAGSSRNFQFASCGVPGNATAVAVNLTAVPIGKLGYVSMWPAGQTQPQVSTLNSLDGRIKANAAITALGAGQAISVFATDTAHVILDVNGYFVPAGTAGALAFYASAPCRVLDTRQTGGAIPAQSSRRVSGGCLPANSQAYSLNLTSVPDPAGAPLGYLTIWPDGAERPTASSLNNLTGAIVANAAIVRAGAGGAFQAFVTDRSHLVVDLNGSFAPPGSAGALRYYTLAPCRVFDTRNAVGPFGGPSMIAGQTREFTLTAGACGLPSNAVAVVANATAVPQGFFGYLTLWPASSERPAVSTLNAIDGSLTSNAAILPVGPSAAIRIFTSDAANVFLDISGYFAP